MTDNTQLYQQIRGNLALPEALEEFLLAKSSAGLTTRTITYYRAEIGRFVDYAKGQGITGVLDVNPTLIRMFLQRAGETRNKGGVAASWRPIRALMYWYEEEVEPENWKNPARKIKIPTPKAKAIPGITMDDFQKLVAICKGSTGQRDRALFYCLLDTCARAQEFINFNIGDINMVTGDVLVQAGKGGSPRFVHVETVAKRELRKYLAARSDIRRDAPLFANKKEARFSYDSLVSLVRWRSGQAKIDQPGLHDFRRAGALEMLRNGADISEISRYLGHSGLDITMRYLAIDPDDLREMHRRTSPVNHL